MRRLVLAFAVSLGLAAAFGGGVGRPGSVAADLVSSTQATLTCNDGHSVVMALDQTGLTNLLAEVQAVNTSGALSCTVATDPTSSESTDWTVYDYNPSNQAIAPRNSPKSMPATTTGSTTTFQFRPSIYTALLTTTDKSLDGDLSAKTLTDMISLSGNAASFMTQDGGGDCTNNVPAAVRFFFTAPSASGPSTGTPPAGFYTSVWWSNPENLQLLTGNQTPMSISAHMYNPAEWSDWNGQNGANPAVIEAFTEATHKVQSIGLSFGGECFFETGVTPTDGFTNEQFTSMFSEN
jgi:hypothetical protein